MCKHISKWPSCFPHIFFLSLFFENRHRHKFDRCSCLVARPGPRRAGQVLWHGTTRASAAHAALSGMVVAKQRDPRQEEEAQTRPPRRRYPSQNNKYIILLHLLFIFGFLHFFLVFVLFYFLVGNLRAVHITRIHLYYFFTLFLINPVVREEGFESGFERTETF